MTRRIAPLLLLALISCSPGEATAPAPTPLAPVSPAPPPRPAEKLPTLPMPARPAQLPPQISEDFSSLGSAPAERVVALVGPPDERVPTPGGESWLYRRRARGALGSAGFPEVRFQDGRVVQVTFHPTEESLLAPR